GGFSWWWWRPRAVSWLSTDSVLDRCPRKRPWARLPRSGEFGLGQRLHVRLALPSGARPVLKRYGPRACWIVPCAPPVSRRSGCPDRPRYGHHRICGGSQAPRVRPPPHPPPPPPPPSAPP